MLGSSGPQGSCSNISRHCFSPSKHVCTLHPSAASYRALATFTFRKICPMMPVAVCATLSGKWELTTYNAFSMLSGDPFTTSQSSTRAYVERMAATWYHVLYGGHWLPLSSGSSGSSTRWISCQLCQLYFFSSFLWQQWCHHFFQVELIHSALHTVIHYQGSTFWCACTAL